MYDVEVEDEKEVEEEDDEEEEGDGGVVENVEVGKSDPRP